MKLRLKMPIRLRFMLTFLLLVTLVVGLITFSTASIFQEDKQGYVNGLTSMVVQGTAEEARDLLAGYREKIQLYGRLLLDSEAHADRSETLSRTVFDEFPELLSISVAREGKDPLTVYNVSRLRTVGLTPTQVQEAEKKDPLPAASIDSERLFLRNTTLVPKLPSLTLAFRLPGRGTGPAPLVSAGLQSDRLQSLMSRFTAYTLYLLDSEGRVVAHSDARKVAARERLAQPAQLDAQHAEYSAGMTREYVRDGTPMIGGVASVDLAGALAGAEIPRSAAQLAGQRLMRRLLVVSALLLVGAVVVGTIFAHRITRPVERLSQATRLIGTGEFDVRVDVDSRDEIGELGTSFNQMADRLRARETELKTAHEQLVQSEKMAAFGQLGAGIAHEVKNPLTGILGCVQLMMDDVDDDSQFQRDLRLVEKETKRCKQIIDNLMRFARQEKAEKVPTDVNAVIADAIAIVRHQLEINNVRPEHDFDIDLPPISANGNQLQQVFINFLVNAQQAMEGPGGRIHVSSRLAADGVIELRFADTGPGIPEEIRDRLFEPFFTTKPAGKGTGLGLSVSYGIVRDHGGAILVESEVGKGTTFVVRLPAALSMEPPAPTDGRVPATV